MISLTRGASEINGFCANLEIEREKARRASEFDLTAGQLKHLQPACAEQLAQPLHQLALVCQGEVEGPAGEVEATETESRVGGEGSQAKGETFSGEIEGQAGEIKVDEAEVKGDSKQKRKGPAAQFGRKLIPVGCAQA